jgi:hypothetical protein
MAKVAEGGMQKGRRGLMMSEMSGTRQSLRFHDLEGKVTKFSYLQIDTPREAQH